VRAAGEVAEAGEEEEIGGLEREDERGREARLEEAEVAAEDEETEGTVPAAGAGKAAAASWMGGRGLMSCVGGNRQMDKRRGPAGYVLCEDGNAYRK